MTTRHITPSAARIAAVEALATELAGITADGRCIDANGQPGPVAPTERGEQLLATIAARKAAVAKRARLVPLLMAATDVWDDAPAHAFSSADGVRWRVYNHEHEEVGSVVAHTPTHALSLWSQDPTNDADFIIAHGYVAPDGRGAWHYVRGAWKPPTT